MENNANQLNPILCKRNCGFFGNSAYEGYCSKCYKEHVKRQNSGSAAGRVTPTSSSNTNGASASAAAAAVSISTAAQQLELIPSEVVMSTSTGEQSSSITIDTSSGSSSGGVVLMPSPATPSHQQHTAPIAIPVLQQPQTTVNNDDSSTPVASAASAVSASDPMSMSCDATTLMSTQQQTPSSSLLSTSAVSTTSSGSCPAPGTSVDSTSSDKKKRSRCSLDSCKRKVGLTGFDCRCGGLFCWEHRYSDKHNCQFDYKELGQDQIRKNNPIVVGEKIQKI